MKKIFCLKLLICIAMFANEEFIDSNKISVLSVECEYGNNTKSCEKLKEVFETYGDKCKDGNIDACFSMFSLHENVRTYKDGAKATEYLERSCLYDNVAACAIAKSHFNLKQYKEKDKKLKKEYIKKAKFYHHRFCKLKKDHTLCKEGLNLL